MLLVLTILVIFIVAAVAGCGAFRSSSSSLTSVPEVSTAVTQASGADAQGPGATMTLNKGKLSPTDIQVTVGSAVTIQDTDDDATRTYHLVSSDGTFDTGILSESGSYTVLFQKAGTYQFQDKEDPTIKGTITVR
jgi:plastocyanin